MDESVTIKVGTHFVCNTNCDHQSITDKVLMNYRGRLIPVLSLERAEKLILAACWDPNGITMAPFAEIIFDKNRIVILWITPSVNFLLNLKISLKKGVTSINMWRTGEP